MAARSSSTRSTATARGTPCSISAAGLGYPSSMALSAAVSLSAPSTAPATDLPFSIGTDMLSAGDAQLTQTGGGALTVSFTDASGNAVSSVRQGEPFYVRVNGTPAEPITITVKADTANAVTMDANRGRMYVPTDGSDVQPVGTGGVAHTTNASASLTLPTLNPPAPPVKTGEPVTFKKTDEATGAALRGAVIRIDTSAGDKVWQGRLRPFHPARPFRQQGHRCGSLRPARPRR